MIDILGVNTWCLHNFRCDSWNQKY